PRPPRTCRRPRGVGRLMRRGVRILGTALAVAGILILAWALVVWQWQDPFTALYTKWKQHQLAGQYNRRARGFAGSISGVSLAAELPYGTSIYTGTRHRIVAATDLSVLRSPRHELLELQACHPRFFASHRYIAYARLTRVEPHGARPYELGPVAAQASGK